jgi:hypothetical protein
MPETKSEQPPIDDIKSAIKIIQIRNKMLDKALKAEADKERKEADKLRKKEEWRAMKIGGGIFVAGMVFGLATMVFMAWAMAQFNCA